MGHVVSRNKRRGEKVGTSALTSNVPTPTTAKSTTQTTTAMAAAHEKLRRIDSEHGLTEEMMEGLTRSSAGSANAKAKKNTLSDWVAAANYMVTSDMDALRRHGDSMRTLAALQVAKREPRTFNKSDRRGSSRSRNSKRNAPPESLKANS
ncbi:hypothetical protein NESM_000646100 [Novymonas esmeraldas]|uniref:Uncharacterized protein n=1 Tax=Novymonas esmeraldas TaxID=1808958 RepID=A0AAW0ES78_9TRYP